ncbi:MAG: hypothetical protein LQ350_000393 [Teloschistes chrysophthalmus]|nr:MAG: hypothetical protein LQ350_000393 [Niorma chrysophthalma]
MVLSHPTALSEEHAVMDTVPNSSSMADPTEVETPVNAGRLQHGPFSHCLCAGCLEDAKKEAEKRLGNDTFTFAYIKKLEHLVHRLHLDAPRALGSDFTPREEIYRDGRMIRRGSMESLRPLPFASTDPIDLCGLGNVPTNNTGAAHDDAKLDKKGPKVEIKRFKRTFDQYGTPLIEIDRTTPNAGSTSADLSNEILLLVFREFDRKRKYWRRSLEIHSPAFIDLLRSIIHSNVDLPASDHTLRLKEPLMPLFHNRMKLASLSDSSDASNSLALEVKEHTNLILNFMEHECQDVVKVQKELAAEDPESLIKFEYAWLLYAPGTIVVTKENGEYEAFVVESIRGNFRHQPSYNSRYSHSTVELTCWSIDYDGEIFGRVWSTHYVAPWEGAKEISTLDILPLAFMQDKLAVRELLLKRGQQFFALQGQCFREYTGEVWSSHANDPRAEPIRVMVDHLTYQRRMNWPIEIDRKRGPANAQSKNWRENRFSRGRNNSETPYIYPPSPPPRRRRRAGNRIVYAHGDNQDVSPDEWSPRDEQEQGYERVECDRPPQSANAMYRKYDSLKPDTVPDELCKLLAPQTVHGYCMRDKVWKNLNVSQLRAVSWRKNSWERLVMDAEYKEIIQAMVSSTAGLEDLIAGKGAGLVALLHGPPGTGKTLTAECVAESFERPLLSLTCGEIGTDSSVIEERLGEAFDDAITWGAILVLDEADVFLEQRTYENIERNALVSIFLRTLEYFNGILFLTTNRVGSFDQAFQSRIHITLGLPLLDRNRRIDVWKLFLEELAKSQHLSEDQLDELQKEVIQTWSRQSLNGRQIRNSVRTALMVAEKKKEVVGKKHFETVLRVGKEFENYMYVLKKGETDGMADGSEF